MTKQKRQYTRVDAELVTKVREMNERFPDMNASEIAEFTGWASKSTIAKIVRGEYDHLLECDTRQADILDILKANNALLADIATMLVNIVECQGYAPTKEKEAHFRNRIKANRREDVLVEGDD